MIEKETRSPFQDYHNLENSNSYREAAWIPIVIANEYEGRNIAKHRDPQNASSENDG